MKTGYVVTKGCGDDYRILAVFTIREAAVKLFDALDKSSEEVFIEEYPLDIRLDEVMQWRANIFVGSGQIKEIKQVNIIDDPPWLNGWVWGDNFSIAAYDVTKEGAVQKCTTLRTRYLASGLSPAAWNISLSEGEKNALPCGETGSMVVD